MRLLARHLRSNAVAYLAIFVALGGTSYAAVAIPNNSVGNKQLKKDAVDTKKVKRGSLLRDDFKSGQLPAGATGVDGIQGEKGLQGGQGLKGDQGDKGPGGDQGAPGTTLTPSQHKSDDPAADIVLVATDTAVLTAPAVVTSQPTRIHAAATGTFNGDGTLDCVVKLGGTEIGQRTSLEFLFAFPAPSAADGSASVNAGSHVVTFECKDGAGDLTFVRGDLQVTTAAQ